ncbi:hypothetical protein GALMADRAFT_214550 [Galerina marginata CBS 339.88]|uniref:Uncharacterized protein n=1 Tax=Galerina marginata (strain CBS 339.88) TaxID=685588 RepID=A0A067SHX6_GALM3|nr:hypothetical protein GALMADRAFT_214550 [Galerina marginata CBS 339.88]
MRSEMLQLEKAIRCYLRKQPRILKILGPSVRVSNEGESASANSSLGLVLLSHENIDSLRSLGTDPQMGNYGVDPWQTGQPSKYKLGSKEFRNGERQNFAFSYPRRLAMTRRGALTLRGYERVDLPYNSRIMPAAEERRRRERSLPPRRRLQRMIELETRWLCRYWQVQRRGRSMGTGVGIVGDGDHGQKSCNDGSVVRLDGRHNKTCGEGSERHVDAIPNNKFLGGNTGACAGGTNATGRTRAWTSGSARGAAGECYDSRRLPAGSARETATPYQSIDASPRRYPPPGRMGGRQTMTTNEQRTSEVVLVGAIIQEVLNCADAVLPKEKRREDRKTYGELETRTPHNNAHFDNGQKPNFRPLHLNALEWDNLGIFNLDLEGEFLNKFDNWTIRRAKREEEASKQWTTFCVLGSSTSIWVIKKSKSSSRQSVTLLFDLFRTNTPTAYTRNFDLQRSPIS